MHSFPIVNSAQFLDEVFTPYDIQVMNIEAANERATDAGDVSIEQVSVYIPLLKRMHKKNS